MGCIWEFHNFWNDSLALCEDNGKTLTYGQLEEEGNKISDVIGQRCLVFILCSNSIGAVLGYSAFLNHGIVPVMLSSHLNDEMLSILLETYKPAYMWVPSELEDGFKFKVVYKAYEYSLLSTSYGTFFQLNDELALLLTTSGSTGSPKFVRQSYENISANTKSIVQYLVLTSSERPITTLPMNYTYGLSIINTHLSVGATILLTDKGIMQKGFWDFFKNKKATSLAGVPYTYEMLDKLRFYHMDLPSLHTMTQAGGKLTPELHEKFAKYAQSNNRYFIVMYGQCEATARMGYLPAGKAVEKKGSMGIAIPGGRFKLIDAGGGEITASHITGELVYEGKNVTLGYAENGYDLIKGDERNGILATGDMAQRDGEGYYYIVGRKKRFLKIYGNRVNLDEMDRLIKGRFAADIVCSGVDDHMYIFLTDGDIADDVREYAASKTRLNPAAFNLKVIDKIPMNESGKVQYSELEKYYE